ncbi:TRAP dicarboxylate transporter, DctP subunit [Pseudovibrio sp. FO-BEG1]|uniref:C4-dicarboxylate-binding protein DctP n=1 Tax=Pseudovibrio denitrificans TaxID=258256 RepID=A0A1I7DQ48_9HYPH|nr:MULTISPECIES: DctP family TRAP transporter solute-binding subunit [Pseudovibrio]AEV39434.1 TRAP dicarboxylate transporter, DctP subunit [Pseudovibrio sp. FO-BEG1]EEA92964.1 C4-dicarboxylate-binding periplasmic protein [Pseudovibrio sp. JE062]SFU13797.1 C4-dicarboxylate-binding protein DctP [Pseudovibrio denitrificans]
MKKIITAATVAAGMFTATQAVAAEACDPGEVVIKFSHVVSATGHPKGDFATALAERINNEMNGKACMQVFPSSQLFDDDKVMEALLLGDVQIAAPSLAKFEAYTLKYRVFDLPFLFSDMDAVNKFTQGEKGQELLGAMSDIGFVGLGYVYNGIKHFSANKPLVTPADAAGLKFRVQTSDVAVAMIEAMEANAQKLAFKEVYGALQTGVVDGQENTWSNIYTKKFFEVQDGITETSHQLLSYLAVTSQEWLDSLDPEVRDQFITIFTEVTNDANARSSAINEANKQKIIEAGVEVRTLTPEQRQQWVDVMKPVWGKFADDIGQDVIDAAVAANN